MTQRSWVSTLAALAILASPAALPSPLHAEAPKPATMAAALHQVRGFSIQLSDPNGYDSYIKAIDDLANMGCTWVNFAFAARQDDVSSAVVHNDWKNTPSRNNFINILKHAKSRGMYVMLMPIVLLDNAGTKEWRGVIEPKTKDGDDDWDNWFMTYNKYINEMAIIAERTHVDLFCVGSELLSTEPFRQRWIDVINNIKSNFKGKLTYSANWDHYDNAKGGPQFWDQVDFIGMNNYNELASKPGASIAQLDKTWVPLKKDILDFVGKMKKPFLFTEVGWHNLENTIKEPWNYVAEGPINHDEQLHAFQSFFDTWGNVPKKEFMGAFVWEWRPGAKPEDHGTYSLQGTPALKLVQDWMKTR